MMRYLFIVIVLIVCGVTPSYAGFFEDLEKGLEDIQEEIKKKESGGLSEDTIISGLKEALQVGTDNAVKDVSKVNGYFRNPKIKIPLPEELQDMADMLRKIGFQKDVDRFIKSMNRAAEKAAPKALDLFINAIKKMTIADARRILEGGETAATEYFREKTSAALYTVFKPPVSKAMDRVGVTRDYKRLVKRYKTIPLVEDVAIDLDHYVTGKALEGLFYMVGEEEKKIRKDPAARVTELLKKVFGKD